MGSPPDFVNVLYGDTITLILFILSMAARATRIEVSSCNRDYMVRKVAALYSLLTFIGRHLTRATPMLVNINYINIGVCLNAGWSVFDPSSATNHL